MKEPHFLSKKLNFSSKENPELVDPCDSPILNKLSAHALAKTSIETTEKELSGLIFTKDKPEGELLLNFPSPSPMGQKPSLQLQHPSLFKNLGLESCLPDKSPFNEPGHFRLSALTKPLDNGRDLRLLDSVMVDKARGEFKFFKEACNALIRLFEGKQIDESFPEIDKGQVQIVQAVVRLKSKAFFPKQNCLDKTGLCKLSEALEKGCKKRTEESFKFILGKAFKKLKKSFFQKKGLLSSDEEAFYEFYFGETARSLGFSTDYFCYARTNSRQKLCFNKKYFRQLFQSQKFKADFGEWAENFLWKQQKNSISKKFIEIFSFYERKMVDGGLTKEEVVRQILKDFSGDSKRKLPWTKFEVFFALNRIKNVTK